MDIVLVIAVIVIGFILLAYLVQRKQAPSGDLLEVIKILQKSSDSNTQSLNQRLDQAARVIMDVQKSVGQMSEIGRSMQSLQEFLQSPKLRGNIGEQVLKELLSQMLPQDSFHLQYTFRSGEKVDAAIKTQAGIIPIDSKFPMENYRKMITENTEDKKIAQRDFSRDIRKHIDDISRKYILTDEGTLDYALMYVPSEAVYYEVVNSQDLFDYSASKRVLPVSPTTFYAYMKAILMSFEGQKVEAKAREVLSAIKAIQKEYSNVQDNLGILQKHVTNAHNMMNTVSTSFLHLGQKITMKSLKE
ncbi:MAG: hypothetical protein UT00_C0022G0004 [Parcubacteria group bacterium GW2011_GWA1_38_7]|nr:MAG: hypothetical protein UT00_C0022G0004 [Parcubacteria group bacterium GW2011_GWA1_38_7]